jgi:hypothetical protein
MWYLWRKLPSTARTYQQGMSGSNNIVDIILYLFLIAFNTTFIDSCRARYRTLNTTILMFNVT